ncbi:hypothetical protein F8S13_13070 [Chloroflexia bacterium SDU3-3]|nr:hypothetical protein F8S13_13070 [Chloroflexia bacterium SDU3-3]
MRYFRNLDDERQIASDEETLRQDLEAAQQTIRRLAHQIRAEQGRCEDVARSYNQVVAKLVTISRENAAVEHERDMWRQRTEQRSAAAPRGFDITPDEARAIRKAMARLHHPDQGGDPDRMKEWNAILDQLEG